MRTTFSPCPEERPATACRSVSLVATLLSIIFATALPGLLAQDERPSNRDAEPPAPRARNVELDHPAAVHDVRVSSFQNITPGETTLAEVKNKLGQPLDQQVEGDQSILVYEVGPFPRIEFTARLDVVTSIIIHMASPGAPDDLAEELGLSDFVPVLVVDEVGEPLGQSYPERGVVFSFDPDSDEHKVSLLLLEPIAAESFLLRAKGHEYQYQRVLADLDYVSKLDHNNSEARWLKARTLWACQQHEAALDEASAAVSMEAFNPHFRLTRSALLFEMDQYARALADTQKVFDLEDVSDLVKARAECQLGDLLAEGPQRDFRNAIAHHQAAVELAAPAATSEDAVQRHSAKRILIDAHLAVANDITWGTWSHKAEAAAKWLRIANELVTDAVENEGIHPSVRLLVLRKTLASYVGLKGEMDPSKVVAEAIQQGQELIDQAEDPLRKTELRWQLVESLFDAVRIELARADAKGVFEYGQQAIELLDEMAPTPPATPHANYLIGRLHFYLGSTHAIGEKDHQQAVRSYEKALPYLSREVPRTCDADRGLHGQRFVSMGVSYWKEDARDEAVRLTNKGLELMEQAHQDGLLDNQALAVPYSNLSAMYKTLGRVEEANALAAKTKELQGPDAGTQNR